MTVHFETEGPVAIVTIDRPAVANAVDRVTADALVAADDHQAVRSYLRLRQRNLAWALFAANALIAASGLSHPNGDLYLVALACLVLIYDRSRFGWRYLAISAIGRRPRSSP